MPAAALIISASGQYVTPSPYGRQRPGEDARALEPVDELAREAALADPRLAEDREQVRAAVAHGPCERVLEELELRLAPDERRTRARRPGGPSSASITRQRAKGPFTPFSSSGPASSTTRLADASRYAVGPTRISRGRAACCRRAARFTASPVTNVESESSTTTSPASIPIRASRPSSRDRLAHRERCAGRAMRVVLVRLRHAERGENGVACELLDDPAVLRDAVRDRLEEPVDAPAHDLGVGARDEARGVHDVDEQDRCELALHT